MSRNRDAQRDSRMRTMTDDELLAEIARCRSKERTTKPNKARRSWKAFAEAPLDA